MTAFRRLAPVLLTLALPACAATLGDAPEAPAAALPAEAPTVQFVEAQGPISCPAGGTQMTSVTLFFGLAIPGGGTVSEADWKGFLDHEVTPRFPDGLSVIPVNGQWKDADTGAVVHEKSRALLIWVQPSAGASEAIDEIRATYKKRFKQDSVMRVDDTDCVAF